MRAPWLELFRRRPSATRTSPNRAVEAAFARRALSTASLLLVAHFAASAFAHSRDASPAVAQAPSTAPNATSAKTKELVAFRTALDAYRAGDESMLEALRSSAERLATQYERPDVRAVLAYDERLSSADRKIGAADDKAFNDAFQQVRKARTDGLAIEDWRDLRETILGTLRDIATARHADRVPAARALSLAARLDLERALEDATLETEERDELYASAQHDAEESDGWLADAGFVTPRLEPIWLLARLDDARGRLDDARERFEDCLRLARRVSNDEYQERALDGLIGLAREAGDLLELERRVHALAEIRDPVKNWNLAAHHADFLLMADRAAHALTFLERTRPADPAELRAWHLLYAAALQRAGSFDAAAEHYALGRREVAPDAVDANATAPLVYDESDIGQASLALQAGDPERALARLGDDVRLARSKARVREHAWRVIGLANARREDWPNAITAYKKSLALGSDFEQRIGASARAAVFGERIGLETVALLAAACTHVDDALGAAVAIEHFQSRALRGGSSSESAAVDADLTEDDLRAWARTMETGLITWVVGADTTVCVHVARDGGARAAEIAIGRAALDDAVRRMREAVIGRDEPRAAQLAREIESVLVPAAIRERIPKGFAADGARILCLVHGPLESLPLDRLPLFAETAHGTLVSCVLPGLPSALPAPSARLEGVEWRLLGAPLGLHGETLLPGADAELAGIAALRPRSRVASGASFTRAALRDALASTSPLHIATHLRTACAGNEGEPDRAGLELSNGEEFCSREIQLAAPKLPLVVLSACATGVGRFLDSEPLDSLARSFLKAGTRNLLVTLWPVEDGAARTFALAFHRALARGKSPSRAACAGREALREAGIASADWAAFRFLGSD